MIKSKFFRFLWRGSILLCPLEIRGDREQAIQGDEIQPIEVDFLVHAEDPLKVLVKQWNDSFSLKEEGAVTTFEYSASEDLQGHSVKKGSHSGVWVWFTRQEWSRAHKLEKESELGVEISMVPLGIEALALFVEESSPLEGVTLTELDALFSSSRLRGGHPVDHWRDLAGMPTEGERSERLIPYLFEDRPGEKLFQKKVLVRGAWSPKVEKLKQDAALLTSETKRQEALVVASLFHLAKLQELNMRVVPMGRRKGLWKSPTRDHCYEGRYPLVNTVSLYYASRSKEAEEWGARYRDFLLSGPSQKELEERGGHALPSEFRNRLMEEVKEP